MELIQASQQWRSRPDDERFLSLDHMYDRVSNLRSRSREAVKPSRDVQATVVNGDLRIGASMPRQVSHFAFGQLCQLAGAPAGYLRELPAEMAADNLNYGLRFGRENKEIAALYTTDEIRAFTGPKYGRIWNADIVQALQSRFGDGVTGDWRVPGEFGELVEITKANTTLFAGDRDMFVFLADENRRIEIPGRRAEHSGSMARGFFVWNSEVGSTTFGLATFLFDYVCANRIVWGAAEYRQLRIRHSSQAPERFIRELAPALEAYGRSSDAIVVDTIAAAQAAKVDDVQAFLANRYSAKLALKIQNAFEVDEGRPIETRFDIVTGVTAYARQVPYQNDRVALERSAGDLL